MVDYAKRYALVHRDEGSFMEELLLLGGWVKHADYAELEQERSAYRRAVIKTDEEWQKQVGRANSAEAEVEVACAKNRELYDAIQKWAEAREALEVHFDECDKQRHIHGQRVPIEIRVQQAKDEERLSSALEEASEALAALTKHEGE